MEISKALCPDCNKPLKVSKMACPSCKLVIEGEFEVSPLAQLAGEDQAFVIAFVKEHGSIKKMESLL